MDGDAGDGNGSERLHGVEVKDGVKDAHTHTQVVRDNGGELAERVGTWCEQLVVLPREKGEGVCPLEAGHGQVSSVVPREVEGVSAADGCTRSLGGVKTPGALVEVRIPGVSVPVCVVESVVPGVSVSVCAVTSVVPVCVVSRTHTHTDAAKNPTHAQTIIGVGNKGKTTAIVSSSFCCISSPKPENICVVFDNSAT